MQRRDEHQISRRPGIEIAVRKNTRHAELGHVRNVARANHLPFVRQQRIDPRVVRPVANRVVVKIRHRLVQIVQHLRVPVHVGVHHVFRKLQRHAHGVAVVVVRHVLAPINQRRIKILRMRQMPFVNVHHAVAPIHFHHRRDQRDHAVANFFYVRAFVHRQPVRKFHQRGRRAGFRRMNCSGNVVNRNSLRDDFVGFRVVQLQRARIAELRQLGAVFFQLFQILFGRNRHRDHLAAFFRRSNRKNFHARAGLLQHPHVFVHVFRVRQNSRRARHVAQHRFRRRNIFRCRQIVHQRRSEKRLRRVLLHLRRVGLVHCLLRIAARPRFTVSPRVRCEKCAENGE